MQNLTFITGGARSGKSVLAEKLASSSQHQVYYLATMESWQDDSEQMQRIESHKTRRPQHWKTIECPRAANRIIDAINGPAFVLFDCLTLYITNILLSNGGASEKTDAEILSEIQLLLDSISRKPSFEFVIVSNEVGFGIVPENKLARRFRDLLGLANQQIASAANQVYLTCSGIPLKLK